MISRRSIPPPSSFFLQVSSDSSNFQTFVCLLPTVFLQMKTHSYSSFFLCESISHPLMISVPEASRVGKGRWKTYSQSHCYALSTC